MVAEALSRRAIICRGMTMAAGTGRGASRVAAVIAAYALVLQAFFAGAAAARVDVVAHDDAAYVLCLGAGGSETPAQRHDGTIYCALCAASAQGRAIDTAPAILPVVYDEGRLVAWPFDFDRRPATCEFLQHRTRGPPTA
jgi:hypothetical protein